jgi:hypothetical protein
MLAYPDPAVCFINPLNAELNPICHLLALLLAHHILHVSRIRVKTHFHEPYQFYGDIKLNENIIQDMPPKRIMSFLEVCKQLMHCLILFPFLLKYLTNAEHMIIS